MPCSPPTGPAETRMGSRFLIEDFPFLLVLLHLTLSWISVIRLLYVHLRLLVDLSLPNSPIHISTYLLTIDIERSTAKVQRTLVRQLYHPKPGSCRERAKKKAARKFWVHPARGGGEKQQGYHPLVYYNRTIFFFACLHHKKTASAPIGLRVDLH